MTYLGLNMSRYINGVAKKHGEISRLLFAGYCIDAITNGVHVGRWVSPPFAELFDRHVPMWRRDNFSLRYALSIPREEVWSAHTEAKRRLLGYVREAAGVEMEEESPTLGFARRTTPSPMRDSRYAVETDGH